MNSLTKTNERQINQFSELILGACRNLKAAGVLLAEMLKENPDVIDEIVDRNPVFTHEFLHRIHNLGLGNINEKFLLVESAGARAIRKLPRAIQDTHAAQPVDVLLPGGDVLKVDVLALTPEQSRQVFANDGVRSLAAQRAWLESESFKKAKPAKAVCDWKKSGNRIVTSGPLTLDRQTIIRMLQELE